MPATKCPGKLHRNMYEPGAVGTLKVNSGGFPRPDDRRRRQHLVLHGGWDVPGRIGRRCRVGKGRGVGALGQQHEVVAHRDLRQRADRLQPDPQGLAGLGRDGGEAELHLVVAGEVDDPRLGLPMGERGRQQHARRNDHTNEGTNAHRSSHSCHHTARARRLRIRDIPPAARCTAAAGESADTAANVR